MSRIRQIKTTFTAGEISRSLLGRGDLRAYDNGAMTLRNVFIQPTGGVTRRAGTRYVDTARGPGRLISFEFNTEQVYLLVLTAGKLDIYADGGLSQTIDAPWEENQVQNIAWTQSADTMLIVHPDISPLRLVRQAGGNFALLEWEFFVDDGVTYQPYYKFADPQVNLTPSATTGTITITASASVFVAEHQGVHLRIGGKEVLITDFDSGTVVSAQVVETLAATSATIDWEEQAFSAVRGYPATVAFHQGRLVIGGSRDLPNRLWFSKSNDMFNFDQGTGLDDESIEFAILSDQVNAIRGMFAGRHLQVFTSGSEWMVSGTPLTPTTVQVARQTRIGSLVDRHVPPVNVEGATLFIARNRQQICEFIYTDLEQAYQTTDLALLSRHMIVDPVDQDFDPRRRLLFIVRGDGKLLSLTVYRAEAVAAWTMHETGGHETGGAFLSVAVVGDNVYTLVQRAQGVMIEQLDDALDLDCALEGTHAEPAAVWAGLGHLEGERVSILADGVVQADQDVHEGSVTLENPARQVVIGLPFTHVVEPLPPGSQGADGAARAVRLIEASFRIEGTAALRLDTGRGLRDIALRQIGVDASPGLPPPVVSGDIRVRAFGWMPGGTRPLWRIEQSVPLPFTLLAVSTELTVND
ncbi:MAG: hypothetical protein JWO78_1050 [Micavibrio sp.]|nr:hypothetical protein [Micavibrio sp.]